MTKEDPHWVMKTIKPKSDQLNADDLLTCPIQVVIDDVTRGTSDDQPIIMHISDGFKPWKPCKTMRRVLIAIWGSVAAEWIGRQIVLVNDPTVKWGGAAVGGIRILAMSHIEQPVQMMITMTRGQRKAITVQVIVIETPPPKSTFLADWRAKFAGASPDAMAIAKGIAESYHERDLSKLAAVTIGIDTLGNEEVTQDNLEHALDDIADIDLLRTFADAVRHELTSVAE